MNRLPLFAAVALTLACTAIPAPAPLQAATSLQKCRSADGSIGYTDGSCRVFGNDSTTISSKVLDVPAGPSPAGFPLSGEAFAAAEMSTTYAPGRRSPADGCARTPTQLAMDLHASIALGDVNRVAESYDWAGMSNEAGQRTMDRLQGLIGRPVLDSRYLDASIGFGGGMAMLASSDPAAAAAGDAGMLQLLLADGDGGHATSIDFDVHRYAGCYFVAF